jgi:1,4-dihydroxy-2-naphthoyl-CoA hydrolase
MATFQCEITVSFKDTDASGVIFFANQLVFAHDALEKFMGEIGHGFRSIMDEGSFLLPIVHAEADYSQPVTVGDLLTVELSVARLGTSSVTIDYKLNKDPVGQIGTCRTIFVAVDRASGQKISLPESLRQSLAEYRS